jgi:hypothetical protein
MEFFIHRNWLNVMIRKILAGVLIMILLLTGGLFLFGWSRHEPRPEGTPTPEADEVARKVLKAINKEAWDSTGIVQWSFPGGHDYLWDKGRGFVQVRWGQNEVLLYTRKVTGIAFESGAVQTGEKSEELIQTAWSYFCNDSWWLNAPSKVFDPGVQRSLITLEDGREALFVEYTSGGVTPGDAYAWILDENGLPSSYKMWVQILPVGGLEFTWEEYTTLSTGARIATLHAGMKDLQMTNIKGAASLEEFGLVEDPFVRLVESGL